MSERTMSAQGIPCERLEVADAANAPELIESLYVGPIDFTPAGRPVSMVDLHNPDFKAYPHFRDALKTAQVAELEGQQQVSVTSAEPLQIKVHRVACVIDCGMSAAVNVRPMAATQAVATSARRGR